MTTIAHLGPTATRWRRLVVLAALALGSTACSADPTGAPNGANGSAPGGSATPADAGTGSDAGAATAVTVPNAFSPLTVTELGDGTFPFQGTDGRYHVAYDLLLLNATPTPATLDRIEVVDASDGSTVVASLSGAQLVDPACDYGDCARLRLAYRGPTTDTVVPPNESRIVYVDFAVDAREDVPDAVVHHLFGTGRAKQTVAEALPFDYFAAPVDLGAGVPRIIGPPLKGTNWVALAGCCLPGFPHRDTNTPSNGALHNSQRFAIDWKRTNDAGEFVTGDKTKNESYVDYGEPVYAVADGTVVAVLDEVEANVPGLQPSQDPEQRASITLENADGNHVVLDLGGGVYAMYAHFQLGSLRVKVGDRVKRGDELALLGNTGNANASHLHLQLMDGPNILTANGLPYVIDQFVYRGQVPVQALIEADSYVTGSFFADHLAMGEPRTDQLPLNLAIVDFPS